MTTLVTADGKGRIPIRGSEPGRKYLVTKSAGEWRVTPYLPESQPTRNRREWSAPKGKKSLLEHIKVMAEAGLRIERSESGKKPAPPCRF